MVIEYATLVAVDATKADGNEGLTFGGEATAKLTAGHNIGGTKIAALDKPCQAIAAMLKLNQKTDFRAKLHAFDDPLHICYPPHGGLGVGGIQAIPNFFLG
jgi:ergosteryl-3beta-O-L-aspartate synthase